MRVVEHATVELLGQWYSGRSKFTPRWDAVSSGRCRESCYGRRVAGARPWDLGQGYCAATATVKMKSGVLRDIAFYVKINASQKCKQHNVINVTLRAESNPYFPYWKLLFLSSIFTALHVMQTRYSDKNSVRLSVCLSHACIVTKRNKDLSRFLYRTKDNLA